MREREEELHEHGMLVIDPEVAVDRLASERCCSVLSKQLEEGFERTRGVIVEALVARVAEIACGREQRYEVRERERGGDASVTNVERRASRRGRRCDHELSAVKQNSRPGAPRTSKLTSRFVPA